MIWFGSANQRHTRQERKSPMHKRMLMTAAGPIAAAATTANAQEYVGKTFPGFEATDALTGEKFSLEDLRGQVVLIDFWATW